MGDEKVNLTTENADYSDFKVINVEETVTTGILTFFYCEGIMEVRVLGHSPN